jgi:hypothetical protein
VYRRRKRCVGDPLIGMEAVTVVGRYSQVYIHLEVIQRIVSPVIEHDPDYAFVGDGHRRHPLIGLSGIVVGAHVGAACLPAIVRGGQENVVMISSGLCRVGNV